MIASKKEDPESQIEWASARMAAMPTRPNASVATFAVIPPKGELEGLDPALPWCIVREASTGYFEDLIHNRTVTRSNSEVNLLGSSYRFLKVKRRQPGFPRVKA